MRARANWMSHQRSCAPHTGSGFSRVNIHPPLCNYIKVFNCRQLLLCNKKTMFVVSWGAIFLTNCRCAHYSRDTFEPWWGPNPAGWRRGYPARVPSEHRPSARDDTRGMHFQGTDGISLHHSTTRRSASFKEWIEWYFSMYEIVLQHTLQIGGRCERTPPGRWSWFHTHGMRELEGIRKHYFENSKAIPKKSKAQPSIHHHPGWPPTLMSLAWNVYDCLT